MPKLKFDKIDAQDPKMEFESVKSSKKATLYHDQYDNNLSQKLSKDVSLNQIPGDLNRYGHDRRSMLENSSISKSSIVL